MPIRRAINRIFSVIKKAELSALKRLEAEQKKRIFNEGKATNGTPIGKYRSDSHKANRSKRGRQIAFKDLEFEGDLRRSLQVGKIGNRTVYGFATNKQRIIAESQERQTGKKIFSASQREKRLMLETIIAEIKANVRRR